MGMQSIDKKPNKIVLSIMVEHKENLIRIIIGLMMQDWALSPAIKHALWA